MTIKSYLLAIVVCLTTGCGGSDRPVSDEQLSELVSRCHSPDSPLDDPILAKLLSEAGGQPAQKFDPIAAKAFSLELSQKWDASLDQVSRCLGKVTQDSLSCEMLRDCQRQYAEKMDLDEPKIGEP
jgi:hypothetical protein